MVFRPGASILWAAVLVAGFIPHAAAGADEPLVRGLSHVPVAVKDLEAARRKYTRLGFALKPGRPHDNGIRNLHIKFRDGTEVELITASEPRDQLTTEYVDFLRGGDGPAFLALHAQETAPLIRSLRAAGMEVEESRFGAVFPGGHPLAHLFFGGLNHSPTDRPQHFAHRNSAQSLIAVWLAADAGHEERLLARLGVRPSGTLELGPVKQTARRFRLSQGEVLLLPGGARRVASRPIVGVTLRVRDLALARRILRGAGLELPVVDMGDEGKSVFVPPEVGGFCLELRETAARGSSGDD